MSGERDLPRHDERALDLLRRGRTGGEDWIYVAGALLRLIEAQSERIKALEKLIDELTEPAEELPAKAPPKSSSSR